MLGVPALDTANQSIRALEDVVDLTDHVPDLRVVLDHLRVLVERERLEVDDGRYAVHRLQLD